MNDPENFDSPPNLPAEAKKSGAPEQYETLRKLFIATLIALLILSGALNIFFLRQMIFVRKDLDVVRPQVNQLVANYRATEDPQIKNFLSSLVGFGRTHPDFIPILVKYKIVPDTAPRTAAPAPATPTLTPVKPAKK
ncbi:MAG: hypothetical protein ABIP71_02220 [Verrucomicrobiota bacterium]